jgi:alkanesulfonate monooxygenase SsuD/methylene tetrahydromethanopterin reductase-like flavin-dependent oxidoreductase (luciferase family)
VPFPPLKARFERLEETLQIALQMWSPDNGPYEGRHYQLKETLCIPQPLSQPRPPILIGGGGEKKTLRLVAKYADACNVFGAPEVLTHKFDILRQHCAEQGRDYNAIQKTTITGYRGDKHAFIDQLEAYAEAGVDAVLFGLPDVTDQAVFEVFGNEIVPHAAKLKARGRA